MSTEGLPAPIAVAVRVGEILDALGIRHMVCGSIASSIHGEPRSTYDVDFVVELRPEHVAALATAMGDEFFVDPAAVQLALDTVSSCNVLHRDTAMKVDLIQRRPRPFSCEELDRRVRLSVTRDPDRTLSVATAEDVLLSKLEWFRKEGETSDRQWHDVTGLVATCSDGLDLAYVDHWADELDLTDLWQRVRPRAE